MTRRRLYPAINDTSTISAISACNESFDPAQEWATVPFGVYPNGRGLQVFDQAAAKAIVEAFNSLPDRLVRGFRGLPILVGHPDDPQWLAEHPGATTEAVGRLRDMRVAADGLQLRHALNETGKRLLSGDAAAYDSFSPNWLMARITYQGRKAYRPQILKSIGLTNHPNIPGTRIGLNETLPAAPTTSSSTMKITDAVRKLLAELGKPAAADATDEQLAVAVNEAEPIATAAIAAQTELGTAKGQLTSAANEVTALKAEAATLRTQLGDKTTAAVNERTARAKVIVAGAVKDGRIVEAKRAEYESKLVAAANDHAFAAIETEIGNLKPALNTRSRTDKLGDRRSIDAASKDRISAINEAVQKHMKEFGLSHHQSYAAVKRTQPALFEPTHAE